MHMLWFNYILSSIFIFLCFILIFIHYHIQKQRKRKIGPKLKLDHNTYNNPPSSYTDLILVFLSFSFNSFFCCSFSCFFICLSLLYICQITVKCRNLETNTTLQSVPKFSVFPCLIPCSKLGVCIHAFCLTVEYLTGHSAILNSANPV